MSWLAAAASTTPEVPWWTAVVAALLSGLVVGLLAFVGNMLQQRHDRKMRDLDHQREKDAQEANQRHEREMRQDDHQREQAGQLRHERREAYTDLLSAAALVMHSAGIFRVAMQFRSGLGEGVGVLVGQRRAFDPFDIDDRMRRDLEPLLQAWTSVWVIGSQEAIDKANHLLNAAAQLTGTGTSRGKAREGLARLILGEKWSKEQFDEWEADLRTLALARKEFAEVARRELGSEVAELFLRSEEEPATEARG